MNQFYLKVIHRSDNGEIESQSAAFDEDEIIIGMKGFDDIKLTVEQLVCLVVKSRSDEDE